jgi:hypothetical protein
LLWWYGRHQQLLRRLLRLVFLLRRLLRWWTQAVQRLRRLVQAQAQLLRRLLRWFFLLRWLLRWHGDF